MPWTPMAVRAWRTSSSLKGLMIATTSFMVRPSFFNVWATEGWARQVTVLCLPELGIFPGKWHKKVAGFRGKHSDLVTPVTIREPDRPPECGFFALASGPAGFFVTSLFKEMRKKMADRSWFYASDGQQQGPYPEAQLRDLITRGTVRADTLVWT